MHANHDPFIWRRGLHNGPLLCDVSLYLPFFPHYWNLWSPTFLLPYSYSPLRFCSILLEHVCILYLLLFMLTFSCFLRMCTSFLKSLQSRGGIGLCLVRGGYSYLIFSRKVNLQAGKDEKGLDEQKWQMSISLTLWLRIRAPHLLRYKRRNGDRGKDQKYQRGFLQKSHQWTAEFIAAESIQHVGLK